MGFDKYNSKKHSQLSFRILISFSLLPSPGCHCPWTRRPPHHCIGLLVSTYVHILDSLFISSSTLSLPLSLALSLSLLDAQALNSRFNDKKMTELRYCGGRREVERQIEGDDQAKKEIGRETVAK